MGVLQSQTTSYGAFKANHYPLLWDYSLFCKVGGRRNREEPPAKRALAEMLGYCKRKIKADILRR
jgi:hypothetical protein